MLTFITDLGSCGLCWDDAGLTGVHFPGDRALTRAAATAAAPADTVPPTMRAAAAAIARLLAGEPEDLREIPLSDVGIDPFARRVYAAAREIGPGEITTYGALARTLGTPDAARAVGAALAANPYPLVVPCHRVLAADGSLRGFSAPGGIATKRQLLEIERAPGFVQPALFA